MGYYTGKKVLVTGHTGFKGAWLCKILQLLDAEVIGYSLKEEVGSLYSILNLDQEIKSFIGDIRDYEYLYQIFKQEKPEIVFHLAAQPLVLKSYEEPRYTYDVNVMGTVNICECIRNTKSVKSFLNITTDKVYLNKEWDWGYRENDELNGYDPYSNSKSCSELVTDTYQNCFYKEKKIAVSTVRAGNVIGGGDFAENRIIPDCFRALEKRQDIMIRNPYSIRPYQHVLEPLIAYLIIAKEQSENIELSGNYNIGPSEENSIYTKELVEKFVKIWGGDINIKFEQKKYSHEANLLKLDCSKVGHKFNWKPQWDMDETVKYVVEWYKEYMNGGDMSSVTEKQVKRYLKTIEYQALNL